MNINFGFSVIARCKKFEKDAIGRDMFEKLDIDLHFNIEQAERFLFRFYDPILLIDDYKLAFKYNNKNELIGITLYQDDYIYIVTNPNQIIVDIIEGYFKLKSLDKFTDILDYDFRTEIDLKDVEDEYGE